MRTPCGSCCALCTSEKLEEKKLTHSKPPASPRGLCTGKRSGSWNGEYLGRSILSTSWVEAGPLCTSAKETSLGFAGFSLCAANLAGGWQ